MNMARNGSRIAARGFTLIELLIVMAILGIMAAIVLPRFSDASSQAKVDSQRTQLQQIRRQLELYRLHYNGALPDLTASWDPLLKQGTYNGKTVGPYLQGIPKNTLNLRTNVVDGTGNSAAGSACGFVFDYNSGNGTGKIKATQSNGTAIFVE